MECQGPNKGGGSEIDGKVQRARAGLAGERQARDGAVADERCAPIEINFAKCEQESAFTPHGLEAAHVLKFHDSARVASGEM